MAFIYTDGTGISGIAWGDVTGTLSDQTDLQAALDALVTAPSSTDEALARYDGTSGQLQDSGVTVTDGNVLAGASIDADSNTLTNIEDADIKSAAAIDATKIADGTVTSSEFQFINSLSSNAQTQIDTKAAGAASSTDEALARFDSTTGKILQNSTVTLTDAGVMAGASIDADSNTLTNIEDADIKSAAAIDATKIADGTVTSAEFQRINSLSSNAQDQLDARVVGAGSVTDEAVARYDGTTGELLQDSSLVTINDSGLLTAQNFNVVNRMGINDPTTPNALTIKGTTSQISQTMSISRPATGAAHPQIEGRYLGTSPQGISLSIQSAWGAEPLSTAIRLHNGTDATNEDNGFITFHTALEEASAGVTGIEERMRINDIGLVIINGITPLGFNSAAVPLQVHGDTTSNLLPRIMLFSAGDQGTSVAHDVNTEGTGTAMGGTLSYWDGNFIGSLLHRSGSDTGSKDGGYIQFRVADAGSLTEVMRCQQDKDIDIVNSLEVGVDLLVGGDLELDGDLNHDGTNVGFHGVAPAPISSAYTVTNPSTDRAYDADATTVDELADVLGTLIADLKLKGLIG